MHEMTVYEKMITAIFAHFYIVTYRLIKLNKILFGYAFKEKWLSVYNNVISI